MLSNLVARFGMCDEFDMMALGTVQSQYLDGGYGIDCAQDTAAAMDRALRYRETLLEQLRALGYRYITLDLEPFASGSFDR